MKKTTVNLIQELKMLIIRQPVSINSVSQTQLDPVRFVINPHKWNTVAKETVRKIEKIIEKCGKLLHQQEDISKKNYQIALLNQNKVILNKGPSENKLQKR